MIAEPLSPELALVDPDLAERARRALPEPPAEAEPPAPAPLTPRSSGGIVRRLGMLVLVPSLFLNVVLLREKTDAAPTARPSVAVVAGAETRLPPNAKPVKAAKAGSRALPKISRRTLSWPAARQARAYDVIVWRGHERMADVWTEKPRVDVDALRCAHRLAPGRYLWFAYPVRRRAAPAQFGPLLKWGRFEVPAGLACR